MQVSKITTHLLATPLKQPILTAIHHFDRVFHVVVEIETDKGVKGTGLLFAQSAAQARLFQAALALFEPLVVGEDPLLVEAVWQKLWKAMNFIGNSGVSIFALSAIDTALWDIVGKVANLPLYRLLSAKTQSMPVYASGGLWLGASVDQLVIEAKDYVAKGFGAVKIRLGSAKLADDISRVRAVRAAIGADVKLLADANQGWDAVTAIKFGRAVAEADLFWLEEPVPYYDVASSREIAAALATPLATGESEYTYLGFARLAQERAADIWMPDLQRIGGITGWRKIAALAESFNIAVSPHLFPEISIHLAVASPTCRIIEYVDWWEELFSENARPVLANGVLFPTEKPGLGLEIEAAKLDYYRVQ